MYMTQKEEITQNIMVEFSKTVELFGLTPLEARLFSYLYLSGKALTLDEMSTALGKSKTTMSTNIRSLLDLNLVSRVWKKGVRKDLYKANTQLMKGFLSFYLKRWKDQVNHQKEALEEIDNKIDKRSSDMDNITDRLQEIIHFHAQLEKLYNKD